MTPLNDWSGRRTGGYLQNTQQICPQRDSNRDPSNQPAADLLLRRHGSWDLTPSLRPHTLFYNFRPKFPGVL